MISEEMPLKHKKAEFAILSASEGSFRAINVPRSEKPAPSGVEGILRWRSE
jgi:hypothetical protein